MKKLLTVTAITIGVSYIANRYQALLNKTSIIQYNHPSQWRFVMSLCINDMVEIIDNDLMKHP